MSDAMERKTVSNLTTLEEIVVEAFRFRYGEDGIPDALALLSLLSSLNIELVKKGEAT